jgi:hypothetical protein
MALKLIGKCKRTLNKIYSPESIGDVGSLYSMNRPKTNASSATCRFSWTINTSSIFTALLIVGNWPNSRQMSPWMLINLSGGPSWHYRDARFAILNKYTFSTRSSWPALQNFNRPSNQRYIHIEVTHRTGSIFRIGYSQLVYKFLRV